MEGGENSDAIVATPDAQVFTVDARGAGLELLSKVLLFFCQKLRILLYEQLWAADRSRPFTVCLAFKISSIDHAIW
jgi:hypothetical protein